MKKVICLVLALLMILSLATAAFAAETKGTIKNDTDRTYKAYQIFSGTQAANSAVLGDIAWGSGINATTFLPELKKIAGFESCTDAASVAAVLASAERLHWRSLSDASDRCRHSGVDQSGVFGL